MEISLRPKMNHVDLYQQTDRAKQTLNGGEPVTLTVLLRGRETYMIDYAKTMLEKIVGELQHVGTAEEIQVNKTATITYVTVTVTPRRLGGADILSLRSPDEGGPGALVEVPV